MHDNNEIPTAIPKFSGSIETVELVRIFFHVEVTGTPNMAAISRKYIFSSVYLNVYTNEIPIAICLGSVIHCDWCELRIHSGIGVAGKSKIVIINRK
jgi:hypothetical protein